MVMMSSLSRDVLWRFAIELMKRGFYVRWHAYEFLIGFGGRLRCLLEVEPHFCRVVVWVFERLEDVGPVLEVVRRFFPNYTMVIRASRRMLEER